MATLYADLVLEVGRKCNLNCEHCLRGESQNLTMSFETAKKIIDLVEISSITFSGGEPTLYGKEIAQIIDYIIESEKAVGYFCVVSNGINYSKELMEALIRFYAYADEPDMCTFDISTDQYHRRSYLELFNQQLKIHPYYQAFSFVGKREDIPQNGVILEGRAIDYCYSFRMPDYSRQFNLDYDDEVARSEMMYVTADGKISPNCDLSYHTFDSLPLPKIEDIESAEDLIEAMEQYDVEIVSCRV